jgi:hypothetical protein
MKHFWFFSLVAALAAWTGIGTAAAADKTAALPIDQAVKIAQDYLQAHNATDHQIIAVSLEAASLGKLYWYAHWQPAISDGQKKQIGLRIDMDGTATVFVTGGSGNGNSANGGYDTPAGWRPQGARTIH